MSKVTIADVAARAGVSKSTVSHALSGKRKISAATRARVMEAVTALDYRPHPVAQRLAGGQRQHTIGYAFPLYAPSIAGLEMQFISSAANVAYHADYAFLLLTYPHQQADQFECLIHSGMVDGVLLMQAKLRDPRVEILRQVKLPFVLVGRCQDNTGIAFVDADIEASMWTCVSHLADLGHRSIAYLHQDDRTLSQSVRALSAFSAACDDLRLVASLEPCEFSPESGAAAITRVLHQHARPTAVIVWNDTAQWGVMQAIEKLGLRIPQDLSLITFNQADTNQLLPHTPTAVDMQAPLLSRLATEMLIAIMEKRPLDAEQVLITPEFVVGDTTALVRKQVPTSPGHGEG